MLHLVSTAVAYHYTCIMSFAPSSQQTMNTTNKLSPKQEELLSTIPIKQGSFTKCKEDTTLMIEVDGNTFLHLVTTRKISGVGSAENVFVVVNERSFVQRGSGVGGMESSTDTKIRLSQLD